MKKVFSTVLIAAVGGVSAVLIERQFLSTSNSHSQLLDYKNETPVHFTTNYGNAASTSGLDFTAAAEISVNAVVHIKTTIQDVTNNLAYDPFRNYYFNQPQQRTQQASGSGVIISKNMVKALINLILLKFSFLLRWHHQYFLPG